MINFGDNRPSGRFFVKSSSEGNDEFINRQKSVFEQLDAVANDKEKVIEGQNSRKREIMVDHQKHTHKRLKYDTRPFRGQESIFKKPDAPLPAHFKPMNTPDHQRNPQNWTRYTLSDVSQEDMSDKSNTAAAMSFLRELRDKKDLEEMEVGSEHSDKITFRKPSNVASHFSENSSKQPYHESTSFKGSKVILPEYVIGEKKSAAKKTRTSNEKTKHVNQIKLGHLNEYDDE